MIEKINSEWFCREINKYIDSYSSTEPTEDITLHYHFHNIYANSTKDYTISTSNDLINFYSELFDNENINISSTNIPLKSLYLFTSNLLPQYLNDYGKNNLNISSILDEDKIIEINCKKHAKTFGNTIIHSSSDIGRRLENEDSIIMVAAKKPNHLSSFQYVQQLTYKIIEKTKNNHPGSTLSFSYLDANGILTIANIGDARTFIIEFDENNTAHVTYLTYDQRPGNFIEKPMQHLNGNIVENDRVVTKYSLVGVSRSLGDKRYNLPTNPEFNQIDIKTFKKPNNRIFVVNSCDGLFETLNKTSLEIWLSTHSLKISGADKLSDYLRTLGLLSGSGDNITDVAYEFDGTIKDIITGLADGHGGIETSRAAAEYIKLAVI